MTKEERDTFKKALLDLAVVNAKLDRIRFAGGDQNPFGIRDLLHSSLTDLMRLERRL